MIKILIVEDDLYYAQTLGLVLNQSSGLEVTGIYGKPDHAINAIDEGQPDLILMDIDLGSELMDGIECMMRIKARYPNILFLILTVYEDYEKVFKALSAGALGYILKSASKEKIIEAIYDLIDGGSPMSPSIARKITLSFGEMQKPKFQTEAANLLTQREKEIIELIGKGKIEKEVANELNLSIKTVKNHIANIYHKLHVNTRVEALNKYFGRN